MLDTGGAEVLGCGSFLPEPYPGAAPTGDAFSIRGMAGLARVRGRGYGAAVLEVGMREAASRGAELMCCNGRTEARGFYERHGREAVGDEFVIEGVGPHHVFLRELS